MKNFKILKIIFIVFIILAISSVAIYIYTYKTKIVTIVKIGDNELLCYGDGLYTIEVTETEIEKFKERQELIIFFNGWIKTLYPAQLSGISKIIILKQKSNKEIPENILKYAYSSTDNVKVNIKNLTTVGIEFTIEDTNNLKYKYKDNCGLYKKMGERWEVVAKNHLSIVNKVNSNKINEYTIQKVYDWTRSYGRLESGEYFFMQEGEGFFIRIYFSINQNGEIYNTSIQIVP